MKEKLFQPAAIALVLILGLGSAEGLAAGFHHRGRGFHGRQGFIQRHNAPRFFGSHPGFPHQRGFDSRHFRDFQSRRFLEGFHPDFHHQHFRHGFRHRQFDHRFDHPGFHFRID